MRLLVMFDLPMKSNKEKKEYRIFRNNLIKNGFLMMQYSVYVRVCLNQESANKYMNRIRDFLPSDGSVRGLIITEKQYEKMKLLLGNKGKNENIITDSRLLIL